MTLNAAPYDVRVWLYPGMDPVGDWGPDYEDISAYVRYPGQDGGQAITYSAGRQNEADQVDAGVMNLTLDNRTGRFSTSNFLSPYWGMLGSNTPIRVGMLTCTDTFTRTVASPGLGISDTGNTWSVAGLWSVTGSVAAYSGPANLSATVINNGGSAIDVDMMLTIIPAATATGASYYGGPVVRYTNGSNYIWAVVEFQTDGTARLRILRNVAGSGGVVLGTVALGAYSGGSGWRVHVMASADRVYASAWAVAGSEPTDWQVSASAGGLTGRSTGMVAVRNGTNSNSATNLLTYDNYQTIGFEWAGLVSQWPTEWDQSGNNCWAAITANGVIRRLEQGKGNQLSALTRQLPSYGPSGYWTFEDGPRSTSLASSVNGIRAAQIIGDITPSGGQGPDGGGPAISIGDIAAEVRFSIPSTKALPSGVHGMSQMLLTKFDSIPGSRVYIVTWNSTGAAAYWRFSLDAGAIYMEAYNSSGTLLSSSSSAHGVDITEWCAWQLETDVVGANTEWDFISHEVGQVVYYAISGNHASTIDTKPLGGTINPAHNLPVGTMLAHAWSGPNTLPFVTNTFSLVSSGYSGELASDRVARVCAEAGIPVAIEAGESVPMGPQPITDALTVLRQCQDADFGILYERDNGLGFRPHSARFRQTVDLILTVASGHLTSAPRGITDDQRLKNKIIMTRDGGSSVTVQDDDSIALNGEYPDPVTVIVESDDQLPDLGGWRLYLGTYPAMRWPQITFELTRNPAAVQIWRGRQFGFRMQVVTGRNQILGYDPDVIVEGYQATLWPHRWYVQMNCSTALPWDVSTLDDSDLRIDADNSTCALAPGSGSVTITVQNNGDPYSTWAPTSTQPAEVPFDIRVNGEVMTVTSVGDLNIVNGRQILAVTRGVNGGSKAHAVGSKVELAYPTTIIF